LSCGVDGIAADSILLKNDEKDSVVKLVEPNKSDKGNVRFYEAGSSSDILPTLQSFLKVGAKFFQGKDLLFVVENLFLPLIQCYSWSPEMLAKKVTKTQCS